MRKIINLLKFLGKYHDPYRAYLKTNTAFLYLSKSVKRLYNVIKQLIKE